MIINHNLNAMNAHRQMGMNTVNSGKSMEKLSSGLRINRAGDDAAGLAISEKMRGQIRGLDQASRNGQDGISMIQTAEGALNETHSILQRMRELSVQSSNDTNNKDDRSAVQKEVEQLKSEIDRIGNTTEFNTTKLIDGSIGAKKTAGTDNAAVISEGLGKATSSKLTGTVDFNAGTNKIADVTGDISESVVVDGAKIDFKLTKEELQATAGDVDGKAFATLLEKKVNEGIDNYNKTYGKEIDKVAVTADTKKISITSGATGSPSSIGITVAASAANNLWEIAGMNVGTAGKVSGSNPSNGDLTAAGAANMAAIKATDTSNVKIDGTEIKVTWGTVGGQTLAAGADMAIQATNIAKDINDAIDKYNINVPTDNKLDKVSVAVKDGAFAISSGSSKSTSNISFDNSDAAKLLGVAGQSSSTQGGGVDFQIGANQGQTMRVTIGDMRSAALGIDKIDMSQKEGAQAATTTLDTAIKTVSSQRAELGAYQNRLEHTINNLGTSSENLSAAESRVRDVDMAKEMMNFSKNNILTQAAQAMLAQANQQPGQVLQLLR